MRPRLFFEETPAQRRFSDAVFSGQYSYLLYGGGIRSGKSAIALMLAQTLCRIFPRSRWAIVRKDLPTIKRNVLPTFSKFRVPGFMGDINQADAWTATASNGSQLVFFPESYKDDPELERWKGLEVNGFFLEEGNELQEPSWRKAIERAGAWVVPNGGRQPPPLIIVTCNPSGGWVKRVFYDPFKAGALAPPFYFQQATIADNPHIPQAYRDSLRNLPEREYKRFVEGDWSFISGAFFDELGADTHVIPSMKDPTHGWANLPPWWTYWGAYDWGFRHPAVFGAFARDGDGTIYWLDTLRMHRMEDEPMAAKVQETMPPPCLSLVMAGHDAFNEHKAHSARVFTVADVFKAYQITMQKANTARVQGWAAVRRAITTKQPDGSVGVPRLRICDTPGNRWAIERLLELTPDPTDPEDVLKVDANDEGEGGDDVGDMLRYALATPFPDGRPPVAKVTPWVPNYDGELEHREAQLRPAPGVVNEYREPGVGGQFGDLSSW